VVDLAGAGIGVIALPATDLYLSGRRDEFNVRRGLTPIRRLLDGGVRVALASNNLRNPFTPVGTADLVDMVYLAALAGHMGTAADLRRLLNAITVHPAAMLRLSDYGLEPGCRADLVAWDCERVEEIVTMRPPRTLVVKNGCVTVQYERRVTERWRDAR
jgi:cytosine deaminase